MTDNERPDNQTETSPRTKAELVARIEQARRALDETIEGLSVAEMEAPGPEGGWSVKDHLAHLAAWEQGIATLLRRRPRWEAMGLDRDTVRANDEAGINAIIEQLNQGRSLQEVLTAFRQTQQDLLDALAPLADDDLHRTYSYYQPDEPGKDSGRPILDWIIGNTYEHYAEHRQYIEELLAQRMD